MKSHPPPTMFSQSDESELKKNFHKKLGIQVLVDNLMIDDNNSKI